MVYDPSGPEHLLFHRYMSAEERTVLTDRVKGETTTVPKAFFNFTVCILASALLSMPYGFDNSGKKGMRYKSCWIQF